MIHMCRLVVCACFYIVMSIHIREASNSIALVWVRGYEFGPMYMCIMSLWDYFCGQCNPDTLGTKKSVLIREVSLFQG